MVTQGRQPTPPGPVAPLEGNDELPPRLLSIEGLDAIIAALRADGRTVFGPVVRDGAITHDTIETVDELPIGWTEETDGGSYRLRPTGTSEVFAFAAPSVSWKRFVHPERTLVLRARRNGESVVVSPPQAEVEPVAFFGVRSCDLAALGVLDRVFDGPHPDPGYRARRRDVFIVAAACAHPADTCFCSSTDTGPSPSAGFDLAVTELVEPGPPRYLVRAGTDRGRALLDRLDTEPAGDADREQAADQHRRAVARMGRRLPAGLADEAARHPDHPRWDDVAARCLACGNCTMVCPTCFCTSTEDVTDLTGQETQRWRVWDSCFTLDFSHLHGGSVRSSISSRYRQWLLHKLVTWHDQFDTSGCVGCGRCIAWCPVGIDLTVEIPALATAPADDRSGGER